MRIRKRNVPKNIGFASTRIAGTDGVSLEIGKWATVLERNGFNCFYFSGENDRPREKCAFDALAHFLHPEIQGIHKKCFGRWTRPPEVTARIYQIKDHLKKKIELFTKDFGIDLLIVENALAIPLNIPLGLALTEFIAETGFPTIAHHHDFFWERDRFLINGVNDYLTWAFPPKLPSIQHVVINSLAGYQLSFRKGISNTIIPNVYDFSNPPGSVSSAIRKKLFQEVGLDDEDLFILQPTRAVARKQIEKSLEIVSMLNLKNPKLVISHSLNDEKKAYYENIKAFARRLGVKLVSIEHLISARPGDSGKGFSIGDVYLCSDLVTYPSRYEGFGNAFLEAVYYRRPIVVNRYSIYVVDIEPKGFETITIDELVTQRTIKAIREVLADKERRESMTDKNFRLGKEYFSYEVLERGLIHLIDVLHTQCGLL